MVMVVGASFWNTDGGWSFKWVGEAFGRLKLWHMTCISVGNELETGF